MANVKCSVRSDLTAKNQENVNLVGKNLPGGKGAVTRKRAVLGEIGNEIAQRGVVVGKKVGSKPAAVQKPKEGPPITSSKNISVRARPPVKKADISSRKESSDHVEDIDKEDKEDIFLLGEYVNDIYDYLREIEAKYPIKEKYLEGQDVTGRMRALLIDWLVDVHLQFHLLPETLYLTVQIIDRYLQEVHNVARNKLQLVGIGAMFVASKYEEMYSPVITDFVYVCDNAYRAEEILDIEEKIVQTLNYSFCRPLPLHFLRRYTKAAKSMMKNHQMAKYILELCLVDYDMCHYPPSLISAAATYLGFWVFSQGKVWTKTLEHYTTYKYEDIEPLVKKLAKLILKTGTSKSKAVTKKYANSKFLKVSSMPELRSDALWKLASS